MKEAWVVRVWQKGRVWTASRKAVVEDIKEVRERLSAAQWDLDVGLRAGYGGKAEMRAQEDLRRAYRLVKDALRRLGVPG